MAHEFERVRSGYNFIVEQMEMWHNAVFEFLTKVLETQKDRYIGNPVDRGGCGFALETTIQSSIVVEVYIDDDGDIVVNTDNDDTKYMCGNGYTDLTAEELYNLCEYLEHYLTEHEEKLKKC